VKGGGIYSAVVASKGGRGQPRAPPFQLVLDRRLVPKSSVVSTERRLSSSGERSQGLAKAELLMSVHLGGITKRGRN